MPSLLYIFLTIPWLFLWSTQSIAIAGISIAALCNVVTVLLASPFVSYRKSGQALWQFPLAVSLFFGAFIPGTLQHIASTATLQAFILYAFFFAVLGQMLALSTGKENPKALSTALILGCLISLIGVWEFISPASAHVILQYVRPQDSLTAPDNLKRAASVFNQRNIFGCYCALLAIGAAHRLHRHDHRGVPKTLWISALLCALGGVAASTSKNALLVFLAGFATIVFKKSSRKVQAGILLVATSGLLLIMTAIFTGPDYGSDVPTAQVKEQYAKESPFAEVYFAVDNFSKGRLHLWKYWWNDKFDRDKYRWTGFGLGQFRKIHWDPTINAHSTYAQFLFEGGFIGFAALLCLLAYGLVLAYRANRLPVYIGFLTMCFFDHFFDYSQKWLISMPWLLLL